MLKGKIFDKLLAKHQYVNFHASSKINLCQILRYAVLYNNIARYYDSHYYVVMHNYE